MQKFTNLNAEMSYGLDVSIYKNALELKKSALLVADNREAYSVANSLLILSTEEVIKSILVKLHAEEYNVYKLKDARKFFTDHKIRHQIAQLIEVGTGFIESLIKYEERQPTKLLKTKYKWINTLVNGFFDIVDAAKPLIESAKRTEELQKFNDLKNKGFYVDYRDALLTPQKEITKDIYITTLAITERIFTFSKGARILFHEKLENHMTREDIEKCKEALTDFIDKAMSDFSFKDLNK